MNRCVVLDAGAMSALAGRPERRNLEVRAALRAAALLDREVVVPAVILAELYRGTRRRPAATSRGSGTHEAARLGDPAASQL